MGAALLLSYSYQEAIYYKTGALLTLVYEKIQVNIGAAWVLHCYSLTDIRRQFIIKLQLF